LEIGIPCSYLYLSNIYKFYIYYKINEQLCFHIISFPTTYNISWKQKTCFSQGTFCGRIIRKINNSLSVARLISLTKNEVRMSVKNQFHRFTFSIFLKEQILHLKFSYFLYRNLSYYTINTRLQWLFTLESLGDINMASTR
jgi:hypothetical protein